MSLKAINSLKMSKVSPTQKLVLLCLADCHNQDNERCDPSVSFIMQFTGLSNRAIANALADLESAGHIKINRGKGFKSSYELVFTTAPSSQLSSNTPPQEIPKPVNVVHGCENSSSEPHSTTSEPSSFLAVNLLPKPVNVVHTNIEEHRKEQRKNQKSDKLVEPVFADTDESGFRSAMTEWFDYKAKRKERYIADGWNRLLNQQRRHPLHYVKASIDASIRNGWKGLFTEKISRDEAEHFIEQKPQPETTEEAELENPINRLFQTIKTLAEKKPEPELVIEPMETGELF